MKKIYELKVILKSLAKGITENKAKLKNHQRKHCGNGGEFYSEVWSRQYEFRHKHIAYCVLRGTPRDMIEKPADNHQPNEDLIKELINEYAEVEDVCSCAK